MWNGDGKELNAGREEEHMNQKTSRTCCDGGLSNYRPRKMDGMGRRKGKIEGGGEMNTEWVLSATNKKNARIEEAEGVYEDVH